MLIASKVRGDRFKLRGRRRGTVRGFTGKFLYTENELELATKDGGGVGHSQETIRQILKKARHRRIWTLCGENGISVD